ncbi:hypothetical protein L6R50_20340 [Myxococcota bacterium]|nr:hypothetical protein [Myxococcota bacterium]
MRRIGRLGQETSEGDAVQGGSQDVLVFVDDRHVPYFATSAGGPVRGRIRLIPEAPPNAPAVPLAAGAPGHRWGVVASRGRVEVDFAAPRFALRCEGYHDSNDGDEPLERAVRRWAWARLSGRGEVRLACQVQDRAGAWSCRRVRIDDRGAREEEGMVASFDGAGLWGVRWPRTLDGAGAVGPAWEDSPFYVRWPVAGGGLAGVAEVVDLERFSHPLVRRMLRYRTRRR